jgi:MoxR-like ATPase
MAALIASATAAPAPTAAPSADTAALQADLAALADRIEDIHASAASVTSVTDAIRAAQHATTEASAARGAAAAAHDTATDAAARAARAEAAAADAIEAATAATSASAPAAALVSRLDAIEHALHSAAPATVARLAVATASTGGSPILARIAPLYTAGTDNGGTVACLISPPSFGKSHAVRALGRTYDTYLEHGCSDDMDEISTLLGTVTPDGSGGFIVTDGVLTQALRSAAAGASTLLFLDEVFRLSARAQEWLLTFLAPSKGRYTVRTRRALPDGTLETLSAPMDKLHIITAGNLGLMPPPEAFWSRLHKVRIAFDVTTLRTIARAVIDSHGIRDNGTATADKLAAGWAATMATTRQQVKAGALAYPADIRILERACRHATTADVPAVVDYLTSALPDALAAWDGDLGDALPQSTTAAAEAVATLRKAAL